MIHRRESDPFRQRGSVPRQHYYSGRYGSLRQFSCGPAPGNPCTAGLGSKPLASAIRCTKSVSCILHRGSGCQMASPTPLRLSFRVTTSSRSLRSGLSRPPPLHDPKDIEEKDASVLGDTSFPLVSGTEHSSSTMHGGRWTTGDARCVMHGPLLAWPGSVGVKLLVPIQSSGAAMPSCPQRSSCIIISPLLTRSSLTLVPRTRSAAGWRSRTIPEQHRGAEVNYNPKHEEASLDPPGNRQA